MPLDEGTYQFTLKNGTSLTVYASSLTLSPGDWGFQHNPNTGHHFAIGKGVDLVMTHRPPKGIMDYTVTHRKAGCDVLISWEPLHEADHSCIALATSMKARAQKNC